MLATLGFLLFLACFVPRCVCWCWCCIALTHTHSNAIFVLFLFSPPVPNGEIESRDRLLRRCRITSHADLPLPRTKFQIIGYPRWADSESLEPVADVLLECPQAHELLDQFRKQGYLDMGRAIRSDPAYDDHETHHGEKYHGRVRMSTDIVDGRFTLTRCRKGVTKKPALSILGVGLRDCRGCWCERRNEIRY